MSDTVGVLLMVAALVVGLPAIVLAARAKHPARPGLTALIASVALVVYGIGNVLS